jgi:hypothetical protein
MIEQYAMVRRGWHGWAIAAVLCFTATILPAQQSSAAPAPQTQSAPARAAGKITPDQERQLFALVDTLIKFSSDESGLPIKSQVKRQIISRASVEDYLKGKFEEDQSARRLQRDEIVLKKFGLLDRDFALKPFLLALLKEQIEAYYDSKDKTVYMLDWVNIEEQKPVLAHELTHALQDQHSDLEKWSDQTPDDVSLNSSDDTDHLAKDEMDTARQAVVEGQATAVMMDYILKPVGKSLVKDPEVMDFVKQQMAASQDSPVLARAPLLLSEALVFPYREGLSFEQDVWMDQGQTAAFAGTLDHPPTSSWEIINPREYEKRHLPAVPLLPNFHPLVDKLYKPYDIGQMGQLDVRILAELFGGEQTSRDLTPAWDGGLYWAGQRLSAKTPADHPTDKGPSVGTPADHPTDKGPSVGTPAEQASTDSIAIFYLSAWKNAASAQAFAKLYADELGRKYSGVKLDETAHATASVKTFSAQPLSQEQVYTTSEGPVVITTRGKLVFVAESFPLDLARQLTALVLDAQGTGEMKMAAAQPVPESLTSAWIRFFSNCGVMKAAVDAEIKAAAISVPSRAANNHAGSLRTKYSSRSTATSTAVGTETSAPTTPSSAEPSTSATRIARPGRSTLFCIMRGVR